MYNICKDYTSLLTLSPKKEGTEKVEKFFYKFN